MESSQITVTISLVMIVLFTVAIIGFSIGFANDNSASINIADDSDLSSFNTQSKEKMGTFKTEAESTYTSISKTTINPSGSDIAQSTGPFSLTVGNLKDVISSVIFLPYKKIFGSGDGFGIFFTTFIAFLVFVLGLLLYKTLRGNP